MAFVNVINFIAWNSYGYKNCKAVCTIRQPNILLSRNDASYVYLRVYISLTLWSLTYMLAVATIILAINKNCLDLDPGIHTQVHQEEPHFYLDNGFCSLL